ncbi:monocarboxylate transporter 9 [Anastrepha ludens]|uniref:monocarboxylate transporter 9 n=1 Tax=Anastrepha ludens TaxID=28586 RepID=UPI0023B1DE4B|nr:monocarboxylate transporter 9 [Anastrepha ludens]XP_053950577.1 monocarboxylate transporter 9 [Anastrepha ludens]XP_053950578.1 monocarboxylate transporter 9 [Anastrepha ludens]XP_053950579.1 monocarboxylate transporter 9 [Anastrepha ludens]
MEHKTVPNENNNNHSHYGHDHDRSASPHLTKLIIPVNDKNSATAKKIYNTPQIPENGAATTEKRAKKKRRDKSDLGEDFVAPDGGWGWLVSFASGIAVMVTFGLAQQFGIIFRDYMYSIGITSSQLTTIINTQIAVSALTGLLNGPLFRRYTYRQVAFGGAALIFLGMFLSVFAQSFLFYMMSFSFFYAFGRGLMVSASSMAVNTYFKVKRRTATSYQFGVAGMGPIILPHLATFLTETVGVKGTVLIFSGLSLHNFACSLIFQPVQWHVKKVKSDTEAMRPASQHFEEEEPEQFVEPDTHSLARANDGWYGSRTSINTLTYRQRLGTGDSIQMQRLRRLSSIGVGRAKQRSFSTSESIKENELEHLHIESMLPTKLEYLNEGQVALQHKQLQLSEKEYSAPEKTLAEMIEEEDEARRKLPFLKKVVIFFDLDLLRDFTYVNLAMGMTIINFVEINFAILTPFILSDFKFSNTQIAIAMSCLGVCDVILRFLTPLLTAKIPLSNKNFFIIGILGMCFGRVFLVYCRNFYWLMGIFGFLGLFKAFRTIFALLIIPGYVPLKRLPAAAGLQLLMSGIFSLVFGPLVGLIRDATDYGYTLHFLNGLNIIAITLWIVEDIFRKNKPTLE